MKKRTVVSSTLLAALLLASLVMPASGSTSPGELAAALAGGESVTGTGNVPHDCNLNEDVPGQVGTWPTAGDPGRQEIPLPRFVTGGGWIHSPADAYRPDPSLTGRANFGFACKYNRHKNQFYILSGNTEFQFQAADLNFHSDSHEFLLVWDAGAAFGGVGTINGEGPYKFAVWAIDGEPDTFQIMIWEEDEATGVEKVIYYCGREPIAGGGIVIHIK